MLSAGHKPTKQWIIALRADRCTVGTAYRSEEREETKTQKMLENFAYIKKKQ